MAIRALVGIAITVVLLAFALKRGWFLYSLAKSGQPAVGRTTDAPKRIEGQKARLGRGVGHGRRRSAKLEAREEPISCSFSH